METAQKERQLYLPLLLPWPARFKVPPTPCHAAVDAWRGRVRLASQGEMERIKRYKGEGLDACSPELDSTQSSQVHTEGQARLGQQWLKRLP